MKKTVSVWVPGQTHNNVLMFSPLHPLSEYKVSTTSKVGASLSFMHHKPELIANQSNNVQLISKPISNFSSSQVLRSLVKCIFPVSHASSDFSLWNKLRYCLKNILFEVFLFNCLPQQFPEQLRHLASSHWLKQRRNNYSFFLTDRNLQWILVYSQLIVTGKRNSTVTNKLHF